GRARNEAHRARRLLLRCGIAHDRTRARQGPDVSFGLSGREPLSLELSLAPRADAGVERAGKRARGRRVFAAANDELWRLCRVARPAGAAVSRRTIPAGPLRRPSAGLRLADARAFARRSRDQPAADDLRSALLHDLLRN